jgi:hypothetical protein
MEQEESKVNFPLHWSFPWLKRKAKLLEKQEIGGKKFPFPSPTITRKSLDVGTRSLANEKLQITGSRYVIAQYGRDS